MSDTVDKITNDQPVGLGQVKMPVGIGLSNKEKGPGGAMDAGTPEAVRLPETKPNIGTEVSRGGIERTEVVGPTQLPQGAMIESGVTKESASIQAQPSRTVQLLYDLDAKGASKRNTSFSIRWFRALLGKIVKRLSL